MPAGFGPPYGDCANAAGPPVTAIASAAMVASAVRTELSTSAPSRQMRRTALLSTYAACAPAALPARAFGSGPRGLLRELGRGLRQEPLRGVLVVAVADRLAVADRPDPARRRHEVASGRLVARRDDAGH